MFKTKKTAKPNKANRKIAKRPRTLVSTRAPRKSTPTRTPAKIPPTPRDAQTRKNATDQAPSDVLIAEIAALRVTVENTPIIIGEKFVALAAACEAEGRVFKVACLQTGYRDREAYRLKDAARAAEAFERLFGEKPAAPSVVRPIARYLDDNAMLKAIVSELKAKAIPVPTATSDQWAAAVKAAVRAQKAADKAA